MQSFNVLTQMPYEITTRLRMDIEIIHNETAPRRMDFADNLQLARFRLLQQAAETNVIFVRSWSEIEFARADSQESPIQKLWWNPWARTALQAVVHKVMLQISEIQFVTRSTIRRK
jgi:hypothetical protein